MCFSSEEEADAAEAAGPHKLGGMEVNIRRVVMPKVSAQIQLYSFSDRVFCSLLLFPWFFS